MLFRHSPALQTGCRLLALAGPPRLASDLLARDRLALPGTSRPGASAIIMINDLIYIYSAQAATALGLVGALHCLQLQPVVTGLRVRSARCGTRPKFGPRDELPECYPCLTAASPTALSSSAAQARWKENATGASLSEATAHERARATCTSRLAQPSAAAGRAVIYHGRVHRHRAILLVLGWPPARCCTLHAGLNGPAIRAAIPATSPAGKVLTGGRTLASVPNPQDWQTLRPRRESRSRSRNDPRWFPWLPASTLWSPRCPPQPDRHRRESRQAPPTRR